MAQNNNQKDLKKAFASEEKVKTMKKDLAMIQSGEWQRKKEEKKLALLKNKEEEESKKKMKEEMEKKIAEERKRIEEEKKRLEEMKRKAEEERMREEERKKIEEIQRRMKEEMERKTQEEQRRMEEEKKRIEEIERQMKEEMEKKIAEERKRIEEEKKRLEEENRKRAEELRERIERERKRIQEELMRKKEEEELKKKQFLAPKLELSLEEEKRQINQALKAILEEKKPFNEEKTELLKKLEPIQKAINVIEKREKLIEEELSRIEEKEKTAESEEERRLFEKKRWQIEEKRRNIEKERWPWDERKKEIETTLAQLEEKFQSFLNKEEQLKKRLEEILALEEKTKLKTELENLNVLLEKIRNTKEKTIKERDGFYQDLIDIKEKLKVTLEKERKVEEDKKLIDEEEVLLEEGADKRKIEEERWKIEDKRRNIEKERWDLEEEKKRIEIQIRKTELNIQNLEERESGIARKIIDIEMKLKEEVSPENDNDSFAKSIKEKDLLKTLPEIEAEKESEEKTTKELEQISFEERKKTEERQEDLTKPSPKEETKTIETSNEGKKDEDSEIQKRLEEAKKRIESLKKNESLTKIEPPETKIEEKKEEKTGEATKDSLEEKKPLEEKGVVGSEKIKEEGLKIEDIKPTKNELPNIKIVPKSEEKKYKLGEDSTLDKFKTEWNELEKRMLMENLKGLKELERKIAFQENNKNKTEKEPIKTVPTPNAPLTIVKPVPQKPSLKERLGIRIAIIFVIFAFIVLTGFIIYLSFFKKNVSQPPPLPITENQNATTTTSEITIPEPLFAVDQKITLSVSTNAEVKDSLAKEFLQPIDIDKVKNVVIVNTALNQAFSLKDLFDSLLIRMDEEFYSKIDNNFTLFIYSQKEGNRIGFVAKIKDQGGLASLLNSQENKMINSFQPLFEIMGKKDINITPYFRNANTVSGYAGPNFRYQNISPNDFAICYLVNDNYLIFTTSWKSMKFITNKLEIYGKIVTINKELKLNDSGYEVELLQAWLSQESTIYPEAKITGTFDIATQKAVIRFQEKYASEILAPQGLTKGTGIVDEYTRTKLNEMYGKSGIVPPVKEITEELRLGSSGEEVKILQEWLAKDRSIYPEGKVNGSFGPATQKAVIRFQEKYASEILAPQGLTKGTGIVDALTRKKLNEMYSNK